MFGDAFKRRKTTGDGRRDHCGKRLDHTKRSHAMPSGHPHRKENLYKNLYNQEKQKSPRIRFRGLFYRGNLKPTLGLEPRTYALRKHCSTTELSWRTSVS